jgi:hypothetical protein
MAARQGATDAQLVHALRQGFPGHEDILYGKASLCLQEKSAGKQPEGTGDMPRTENCKKTADQKRRTRTTNEATTQPAALAAEVFASALERLLQDLGFQDLCGTWAAERTKMLRMTSKRVKDVVDRVFRCPLEQDILG